MTRALADKSRTIRLPVHAVNLLARVSRAERQIRSETGKDPSVDEIAHVLGLDIECIMEAKRASQAPLSIDVPLRDDTGMTRGDLLDDEAAGLAAHRNVEAQELAERLRDALAELDPRERKVLQLRFGLDLGGECTLTEVAATIGVSRERIRQIEQAALAKLRRMPSLRRDAIEVLAA
jgi:RNA polymerase primary sigma factor